MWEKVRKFGPHYCDLPTMMWNASFLLKALTLNIDSRYNDTIPTIFYIVTPLFGVIYIYVYWLSAFWFVFFRCMETGDLVAAMIVFSLGITSGIGIIKFIFVLIYREKIKNLVKQYLNWDSIIDPESRFSKNLLKYLKDVKKRAVAIWIIINCNGVAYILKPLITPGRHSMEEIFILYGLDPPLETPNYELSYVFMVIGSVVTCYLASNMSAFLILVSGYIEAQLLALSEEIVNLYRDSKKQYMLLPQDLDSVSEIFINEDVETGAAYEEINKILEGRLKCLVKTHLTNINFLGHVQEIFKGAFAFEFIVLSAGLIAELLGGLQNTYIEVPFTIIQVAMDCFVGQRLMDACDTLENALYNSHWERLNAPNMKVVLLMLMNAQKTLTLSAGGVAVLNFVCLMSVYRSVYSAFTTLQSVV